MVTAIVTYNKFYKRTFILKVISKLAFRKKLSLIVDEK